MDRKSRVVIIIWDLGHLGFTASDFFNSWIIWMWCNYSSLNSIIQSYEGKLVSFFERESERDGAEKNSKLVCSWQKYYRPIFWQQASREKVGGIVCERVKEGERDGLYVCVCVCACVLWIRGNELSQALSYEFSQALASLINDTCHSVRVWQPSWEGLWCMATLLKEIRLFWHGRRPCPLYKVPAFLHGFFFRFFSPPPSFSWTREESLLWAETRSWICRLI